MHRLSSTLLDVIVGRHWRGFASQDSDVIANYLKQSLDTNSIEYSHTEQSPSLSDKIGFGSYKDEHVFEIRVDGQDATIRITPAFADPITRGVVTLFNTENRIKSMKDLSVIDIQPITEATERQLRDVMKGVVHCSDRDLWDCSHHPRFVTSVLLQRKTTYLWKYWTQLPRTVV